MFSHLEHANITVEDIDGALKFLGTAFPEFRIRGEGRGPQGHRWLHFGTDVSYLALQEPNQQGSGQRVPYDDVGVNHLGFVVEDVEKLRERLEGAGYSEGFVSDPHPFRKRLYFFDGEGQEWEFIEYLSTEVSERNDYSI